MKLKKLFCLLLSLIMVMGLFAGCNKAETTDPTDDTSITEPSEATDPSGEATEPVEENPNKLSSTLGLDTDVSAYVTLGEYKGVEYVPATWEVTDEEVENSLNTAFPEYPEIKEGKVEDGDNVNITFIGYIDGEEDPNCTYTDAGGYNLTIGSGALIEGFESGLIGQDIGSTVELNLTFPTENYHEDYLGKDVKFDVTINYVMGEAEYPELTDELVKEKTGGEYETVDAYRESVRKNLEDTAEATADSENIAAVMDAIIANATFAELPAEEIDFYNQYVLAQNQSYATMFSMTLEDWLSQMLGTSLEDFEEYNKEAAENYVKSKMVLIAIAQAENKAMSDEEFDARLTEDMASYGFTDLEAFKTEIATQDSLENWRTSYVLNDLEPWLVEQATAVEDVPEATEAPDATEASESEE